MVTRAPRAFQALLWNTGRPCRRPSAPGATCCPAHLSLLAPLDAGGGYDHELASGLRPVFRAAAPVGLAEELQLARLQVRALLAERAPASDVLRALHTVAVLARLHGRLEQSPS